MEQYQAENVGYSHGMNAYVSPHANVGPNVMPYAPVAVSPAYWGKHHCHRYTDTAAILVLFILLVIISRCAKW